MLLLLVAAGLGLVTGPPDGFLTAPQRDSQGEEATSPSADVSADGRFVAFESMARLVAADTNTYRDIYVLDLETRQVTLEPAASDTQVMAAHPRLSGDGRFLVFASTRIDSPGVPPTSEIILSDRSSGSRRLVSAAFDGGPANGASRDPDISRDGQLIVFTSDASNLIAGADANGMAADTYALNVRSGTVERISVDSNGVQPAVGSSNSPTVSGDGRNVAFASLAPLVPAAPATTTPSQTRHKQVYVRDLARRTTVLASAGGRSAPGNGDSWAPSLSHDGRLVAFVSRATNVASVGRHGTSHVLLRDLSAQTTTLLSRSSSGGAASGNSAGPSLSADGRFVAFHSDAPDLVCARRCPPHDQDINLLSDVFVLDRTTSTMTRVTRDGSREWMAPSRGAALDGSGRVLAFASRHPVDALDTADDYDLFVKVPSQ